MSSNVTGRDHDEDILNVDNTEQEREEEQSNDVKKVEVQDGDKSERYIETLGEKDDNEEQIGQLRETTEEDGTDDMSQDEFAQTTGDDRTKSSQMEGENGEEKEKEDKASSDEKQKMFLLYSSILLVVCINCFFNSLQCGFVFDDHKAIITNLDLRPSTPLADVFKNDFWGTPLSSDRSHKSYRPLTILTFRLNYLIGGLEPGGYHLFNLIFHWILCVLIMHVSKMFFSDWLAFILSMMFAVHPIHTDAVSGVVGRAESLSAILALFALKSYTYAGGYRRATDWNYIWITITLAVMATLCKEQGITVVAICCAYEVFWLQKISLWEGLDLLMLTLKTPQKIPLWVVDAIFRMLAILSSAVVLVALRVMIMGAHLPHFIRYDNPIAFESAPVKQLSLCYLFPRNFWLLVYPHNLLCDYSGSTIPLVKQFSDPRNLATLNFLGGLGALTYLALTGRNKLARQIAMALAFLVFPFLPASNIFFPVGFVLAERILYFPSIGFSMLVVIGLQQLLKYKQFHSLIYLLLATTLVLHGARTARRNEDWKSKDSLFRSGLQVTTSNSKLWLNLGHFHESAKEYPKALVCYLASFESEYAIENGALTEIGRLYHSMGDDVKAEHYLTEAQNHMAPPGPKQRYSHKYVQTFYHLADIRMKDEANWPEAENMLKKAIRLNQEYEEAYKKLSELYVKMNEFHKATGILRRYLTVNSRNCNILVALANLYQAGGRPTDALKYYEQCLAHSPNHESAQYNVAVILEKQMGDEGLEQLIERYKLLSERSDQNKAAHLLKLGELYRKAEDYEKAINAFIKTLELRPDHKATLSSLGTVYRLMNETDAASSYLHRAAKLYPDDPKVWQRLGEFYVDDLKKLESGLQYFQRCLQLNPNNVDCSYNICVVLVRATQYNDAEKCLRVLSEKNPSESIQNNLKKVQDFIAKKSKSIEPETQDNV